MNGASTDVLTFDADTLLIPDSRGTPHPYRWRVMPPWAGCAWCCELTRVDGGAAYVVSRNLAGRWSCNCPAARWRPGPCKHQRAAAELEALVRRIAGEMGLSVVQEVAS